MSGAYTGGVSIGAGGADAGGTSGSGTDPGRLAVDARDVVVSLGGRCILDGVSLRVGYGEVHALIGPNGAGKSTLLAAIAGDVQADGVIAINGRAVSEWGHRALARERAVLLQDNQVLFPFTALQVVEMGRSPWEGERSSDDEAAISQAIELTDVGHMLDRPVPRLSGGERARVALARVLAQRTPVMMLDEPTAALDLKHQEDVLRIVREAAVRDSAVIVVLHDLNLAAAIADRITLLDSGRVAASGTPAEVLTAERIAEVYQQEVELVPHPSTGVPIIVPFRASVGGSR